ncbi:MAG: HIRAN domain-containing protein [Anaeroplasmataceae bacterium]
MPNDLKISENKLEKVISNNGVSELIKPLIKEIFLFETRISQTTNNDDLYKGLSLNQELNLIREVNKFNENSIVVYDSLSNKLGYIPEEDNVVFSRLMDAGKLLLARISSIEYRGYYYIRIKIFLKDF